MSAAEGIREALGCNELPFWCPGDRAPGQALPVTSANGEVNTRESERYIM